MLRIISIVFSNHSLGDLVCYILGIWDIIQTNHFFLNMTDGSSTSIVTIIVLKLRFETNNQKLIYSELNAK